MNGAHHAEEDPYRSPQLQKFLQRIQVKGGRQSGRVKKARLGHQGGIEAVNE
jgi:hypothetical protein